MPENPETVPNPPNRIEDKAPKPKGVIPKNAQSLVIIGVAVLMILIMWLTGGKKTAVRPVSATPPPPPVTPTDTGKGNPGLARRRGTRRHWPAALDRALAS